MSPSHRLAVAVLAALPSALGCQAISDLIPTGSTEPSPSPSPSPAPTVSPKPASSPLMIPVILPKPVPTPTPAPTPPPAPAPTAAPPAPPQGSCNLPPSNPPNPSCRYESAGLEAQVETALTRVTQSHPQYFDFSDKRCPDCYYVKNVSGYVAEVQKQLAAQGVCSHWDGEEVGAKTTNAQNEQYDILLASGHMRRRPGAYRATCRPSWF